MPELRTETMTVNMGPQHPSTHGVLRLVLQLDGENVVSADSTVGYLHTGIEKTTEQKKWQQVIPLVERMDYLSAQSNSLAYALSVEQLLGIEMPERVKWIRVLLAELQRLNSHLVWLATHGMELGAVTVMLYCFRERELLLNINELIAGFRMFPSYIRVGGLREDLPGGLPRGRARAARPDAGQAGRVRGPADAQPDLPQAHAGRRRDLARRRARRWGWSGRSRARPVRPTTCARRSRTPATRRSTSTCRSAPGATCTTGTWCASRRCARSLRICRQALERISPTGAWAADDPRVVPPPKDKVYTEMEALIQHFLIYSQGFAVPAGEAYVPVEGPRGEHGCYVVSDGTNRPWRVKMRSPSLMACQALPQMIVGGMIADVIAVIGSIDVVMGDVDR